MGFWAKFYKYTTDKTWIRYYEQYKLWIRASTGGRIIDRFVRIFTITAISVFITNYTLGAEVLPLVTTSLIAGLGAAFDKFKNESLKKIRDTGFSIV